MIDEKARGFFDDIWKRGDFWQLETSEFEREKYTLQMRLLEGRRYSRVLEIGCGSGRFSRLLAGFTDHIVALDVSPLAIARARTSDAHIPAIDFRVANIMEYDPAAEGPWDLIVMSETVYYLGWLYSFWDVAWLGMQLFAATREGGKLLMANACGGVEDYLVQPWIIRTYRDMFLNVGYALEAEEVFRGTKEGRNLEALVSLFSK